MAEHFLLRFPLDDGSDGAEWLTVDASGSVTAAPSRGSLAEAASALSGRVVWILPAGAVSLQRAQLPPRSGKRIATLLPFALEDSLAAEVDTLHFAGATQDDDGSLTCAVVDLAWLRQHLNQLAEAGLTPQAAYSPLQLLPDVPNTTVLLVDGASVAVRVPGELPYAIDLVAGLPTRDVLPLDPAAPRECILYTTAESFHSREALRSPDEALPAGGSYVGGGPQFLEYGALQKYADGVRHGQPINLLQGAFAPRSSAAAGWQRWRIAVYALLACVLVNVVASAVDLYRAHRAETALDRDLHGAYEQALPGTNTARLPSPRLVVESRVRRVAGAAHEGIIGLLDQLGTAVVATPGADIKSLSFHDGSADLVATAPDLATLNRLQQAIGAAAHLTGATTPDAQHAEGRFSIDGVAR